MDLKSTRLNSELKSTDQDQTLKDQDPKLKTASRTRPRLITFDHQTFSVCLLNNTFIKLTIRSRIIQLFSW